MPSIQKLQLTSFRNLSKETLELSDRLNLIAGENGSGKSNILEAIHFLGLGRPFRNTRHSPLIQHGQESCIVFARLHNDVSLGISKSLNVSPQFHIQGSPANSSVELAKFLPFQILNADAFKLLEGGPKARRQFIDWGVFHVEHQYHACWKGYRRCLLNRNILLKKKAAAAELAPWTQELAEYSGEIDRHRKNYLEAFLPNLTDLLGRLIELDELTIKYSRGWNDEEELRTTLENSLQRDLITGHTGAGPHRADLKLKIGQQYVGDILSRGQQKLLVCAMKLGQGAFLCKESEQQCIYLIDDLPAELDRENRRKLCRLLHDLGGQVIITGTEQNELISSVENCGYSLNESKLFHVKHGKISALEMVPKLLAKTPTKTLKIK